MKVSVRGFLQGVCDAETAKATAEKFPDTVITATCIVCSESQHIEKLTDKCNNCKSTEWK